MSTMMILRADVGGGQMAGDGLCSSHDSHVCVTLDRSHMLVQGHSFTRSHKACTLLINAEYF